MYTIGPVVRINPRELHIKDPHYYDTVYASSSKKQEKDPNFVVSFGVPSSMVATVGHNQHRFRRGLLNSFFSKRSVMELLPLLQEKESELIECFEKACQEGKVLELGNAFAVFSADLISQYSWGVSSGFLDDENFNNSFQQSASKITTNVHVHKFFPILLTISTAMPRCLLSRIKPHFASVLAIRICGKCMEGHGRSWNLVIEYSVSVTDQLSSCMTCRCLETSRILCFSSPACVYKGS